MIGDREVMAGQLARLDDEGSLATAGAQVAGYVAAAAVLGGLGVALLAFTRRRRRHM
ncbi:hypothetical protein [Streptomyces sp. NPDC006510]|uniref:hypothetical protein n=1 Tax=Streptomyces sp. NPDC006510 TaxID=3155600 RepID=UPI0033B58706